MSTRAYGLPLDSATLTLPAAGGGAASSIKLFGVDLTVPAPLLTLYTNCETLILLNLDGTNPIWIQATMDIAAPTLALATSLVIPAGSAVTLNIGAAGKRADPQLTGFTLWAAAASGAGGAILNVTQVMGSGSLTPGA
jgi:hypothetical protein